MSKKNLTLFLNGIAPAIRWNVRIKNYIQKYKKQLVFQKDSRFYYCNLKTAINFIDNQKIDEFLKLKILNSLYKNQNEELEQQKNSIPSSNLDEVRKKQLEITHFNIFNIKNIDELAKQIVKDLEKSKIENYSSLFSEYVYCFSYKYEYNSIKMNVVKIRNEIKYSNLTDDQKEAALKIFRFSKRVHEYLDTGAKIKRELNMTEKLQALEVPFLFNFMESNRHIQDIKITKKNTKEIFTILTATLCLSTGRRLSDLITRSKIEKVDKYKIKITGVAKKREEKPTIAIIPTLYYTADEIIAKQEIAKSFIPKGLKSDQAKEDKAHNLTDFRKIPQELWTKGSKFDNLRSIYALVSEVIYNQNNIIEENKKPQATFFQLVLAHRAEDRATYEHYYKRQILLKDLDLNSYLEETKTAMM